MLTEDGLEIFKDELPFVIRAAYRITLAKNNGPDRDSFYETEMSDGLVNEIIRDCTNPDWAQVAFDVNGVNGLFVSLQLIRSGEKMFLRTKNWIGHDLEDLSELVTSIMTERVHQLSLMKIRKACPGAEVIQMPDTHSRPGTWLAVLNHEYFYPDLQWRRGALQTSRVDGELVETHSAYFPTLSALANSLEQAAVGNEA